MGAEGWGGDWGHLGDGWGTTGMDRAPGAVDVPGAGPHQHPALLPTMGWGQGTPLFNTRASPVPLQGRCDRRLQRSPVPTAEGTEVVEDPNGKTFTVSSRVEFRVTKEDNDAEVTCTVDHESLQNSERSTTQKLQVHCTWHVGDRDTEGWPPELGGCREGRALTPPCSSCRQTHGEDRAAPPVPTGRREAPAAVRRAGQPRVRTPPRCSFPAVHPKTLPGAGGGQVRAG